MCLNYRMVIKLALVRPVAQLGKLSVSKKGVNSQVYVCFLLQVCNCMDSMATVYIESIDQRATQSTLSLFSLLEH